MKIRAPITTPDKTIAGLDIGDVTGSVAEKKTTRRKLPVKIEKMISPENRGSAPKPNRRIRIP